MKDLAIVTGSPTLAPGDSIRVEWSISGPDLFQIELHLSRDSALDDTDDRLLGYGCGGSVTDPPEECRGVSICAVETAQNGPNFRCGDPESPRTHPVALPAFLESAEGSAALIVRACNALFEGCDEEAVSLTFTTG